MSDIIGIAIFAVILIALRPIYRAWQRYVNDLNVTKLMHRSEYNSLAIFAEQINKHVLEMLDSQHKILEMVKPHVLCTEGTGAPSDVQGEVDTFLTMLKEMHADYMSDVKRYNTQMATYHFNDLRYLPDGVYSTLPKSFKERLFDL